MENFLRPSKPTARAVRQLQVKSQFEKKVQAQPPSDKVKLQEWSDIVACDERTFDVCALSDEEIENALRLFDLNPKYGPFVGIDRAFRWQRAADCGLEPPTIIKLLIDTNCAVEMRDGGHLW